ncbi:hybrid sensor histidine kinase/response regulator [Desulfopila aestuarii]|uniref:histidine kinase n=1 Tax=Desulfopila aestuarii DSM 18488 TaxID=1121416 RepID=A0A1M7XX80_9BACT|nr:response regulator [Desulfopila aestuarii]SHO43480.1 PAS domain S-box-containing protein [Desulfopila aestuarii DSM 18488]
MSKASILIVEDDGILAYYLQDTISRLGYSVAGPLAYGEDVVNFLTNNPVDLVLMDIELAGEMNGISAAESIRDTFDIPIVFLTGFSHDPLLEKAKIAAPYGYLIKPVPDRELAATIEMSLHRHRMDRKLKISQLALQKSEAKYRDLFENSPLGIFRTTLDGKVLAVNKVMVEILGCRSAEEVINSYNDIYIQLCADRNRRQEFIDEITEKGSVNNFEFATGPIHGQHLWLSTSARLQPGDNGDNQADELVIDGFVINITARKHTEELLFQSNAILQAAMDQSPAGIAIADAPDGRLRYVNNAGLRIRGGDSHSIVDEVGLNEYVSSWQLLDLDRRPLKTEEVPLARAILFGDTCSREFIVRRSNTDDRIVEANAAPVRDKNGAIQAAIVVFTDITEIKKDKEERKILQNHLLQAQKMEAIGTLAGGIAHDFNNILGAIIGYAQMARDDCAEGSTTASDLDQVIKAGHRAKDLVKQILTFSRQEETQQVQLLPTTIVKEAVKLLRSSLPSTIAIVQDIEPHIEHIWADPTKILQIIMNISTNAFHAMEETGGTLTIALKMKVLSQKDLAGFPHCRSGNFVCLSIADSGSGIPDGIRERIFEPYFTTKDAGKGTGMGLAIVHGIVNSYGGCIRCHSQLNKGTVFHIYLPALEEEVHSDPKPIETAPQGSERILFVDDETMLVEMSQVMLRRLGYAVTVRTSSLDALNTFTDHPDSFDLVITDQTMPGMTGIELARRMLQIRPDIPIILCTGYSNIISENTVKEAGIKGFIMKPLDKTEIATLVRKVLSGTLVE